VTNDLPNCHWILLNLGLLRLRVARYMIVMQVRDLSNAFGQAKAILAPRAGKPTLSKIHWRNLSDPGPAAAFAQEQLATQDSSPPVRAPSPRTIRCHRTQALRFTPPPPESGVHLDDTAGQAPVDYDRKRVPGSRPGSIFSETRGEIMAREPTSPRLDHQLRLPQVALPAGHGLGREPGSLRRDTRRAHDECLGHAPRAGPCGAPRQGPAGNGQRFVRDATRRHGLVRSLDLGVNLAATRSSAAVVAGPALSVTELS